MREGAFVGYFGVDNICVRITIMKGGRWQVKFKTCWILYCFGSVLNTRFNLTHYHHRLVRPNHCNIKLGERKTKAERQPNWPLSYFALLMKSETRVI